MNKYLLLVLLPSLLLTFVSNGPLSAQCNSNTCMTPEPSVNAQDACILANPAALDCYFGSTTPTSPESLPPSWCTSIENNHFFAFIADAPTADFQICTFECSSGNAIQAAVLSSSDCVNFQFVSPCLGNIATGTCEDLLASGLTPGVVYYLMIDGNAGALCNYTINGANRLINLGTKYVCQGSCFQLGDSLYCNSGVYVHSFNSYLGCDSIVFFELVVIPINSASAIQTPQGRTITCNHPTLSLQAQNVPNVLHLWKNLGGDTLGTGNSISVSTPGFYFHEVKSSIAGVNCSAQAKMLIKQNSSPPPVTAMGGTIDASHPTVQLKGHSIISGVTYLWTGPNGFTSSLKKPIVSVPGLYTLTVTNPQTGCTNSITVEVLSMS